MAKIGVAGFQHETNTFAPLRADLAAFRATPAYPRMPRGPAMVEAMAGLNLPMAGFIQAATAAGHHLVPSVWAMATPSDRVSDEAFETIAAMMESDFAAVSDLDAVYLCLHGAMVTDTHEDGEGALLERIRRVVGTDIPLVVSLDLHSNTTPAMMRHADALVAYRTYPHVDMAQTGARTFTQLERMLARGSRPARALRRTDFLIPLVWQCTYISPAEAIYRDLANAEQGSVWSTSFTPGFPPADIAECGPAVMAYADTQVEADQVADALVDAVSAVRPRWNGKLYTPAEALEAARQGYKGRPYVLADTQDNPGAGGASDTVGVLAALVEGRAEDAVLAMLYDPGAARAAHAAGVGAELTLPLGASCTPGQSPLELTVTVQALSDGEFIGTGPMSAGGQFRLGPTAALRIGGVRVIVTSAITQAKDQAILRHLGIDPTAQRILALKSSVHFRADFQPIAEQVLVVEAPGPNIADHLKMPYRHLRPDLQLTPLGPTFRDWRAGRG